MIQLISAEFLPFCRLKINLEASLKNIDIAIFYVCTTFNLSVDIIKHDTGVRIEVPIQPGGSVMLLAPFNVCLTIVKLLICKG